MNREELWARLERADYFDWCSAGEVERLRALYFDGVVEEGAPDFLKARELFWHPEQSHARWLSILEQRKRFRDDDGNEHVSESLGKEYTQACLDTLLLTDFLYVGLAIEQQLELLEFLEFEKNCSLRGAYLEAWIGGVLAWLKSQNRDAWDAACFDDSKFASSWKFFYRLIEKSPLVLQGKRIEFSEQVGVWSGSFSSHFFNSTKELMLMADRGKFPRRPTINIETRARFLSDFKSDLETGSAPKLLLDIWALVKN
ncbi:hypothetical protein [Pseudomonas tohonis]|uniref:hypothetical protein n=1 Tax=Pseudomonas tohonis TaxID=2725477 RepID=UPI001F1680EF|nr:hypothetical protein [Pseudomonas tohonis]